MPYLLPASRYTTTVALVIESSRLFRIGTRFVYRLDDTPASMSDGITRMGLSLENGVVRIEVPAYTEVQLPHQPTLGLTDLATIPPMLWGLIGPYGRHLLAALVHDYLCQRVDELDAGFEGRTFADYVFWRACRDSVRVDDPTQPDGGPVPPILRSGFTRAMLLWAGVSIGRFWGYRRFAGLLLPVAVAGGAAALFQVFAWLGRTHLLDIVPDWLGWVGSLVLASFATFVLLLAKTEAPPWVSGSFRIISVIGAVGVLGAVAASLARLLADVPGSVSLAVGAWGIAAFVAGSLALAVKTPNRADALLPLIALIVLPIMLPVAAMTVVAQGLLWFPDALDTRDRTPSLPGPDGLRRKPLDDLARYGN